MQVPVTQAADSEARANLLVSRRSGVPLRCSAARERRTYWAAVGLQMATSLLDLAGVLLFGMVGVIAASAAQGFAIPGSIQVILWFGGADVSATTASLVLAGIAGLLLVLKTLAAL